MKSIVSLLFILTFSLGFAQDKKETTKTQIVEASCGQCQFGMKSKSGCDLAVRMDGKSYFVEGTDINKHGDAHAEDGFCSAIRQAEVVGEVKDNKFVVSHFKLLPQKK
ncbi:DUF6370 family protein [Flavobacterium dankookense]|uniref:Glutaminyl-tRNA synthetase n=1 Tax=Flavobacterium dankookense TaxID=706186 RepID=A0A4R6Q6Q6_9FLAO|nr:DUF6370 family protein [Flavobacterium dankookense]TDP58174.1 hypothetical protein BC748_2203 [Flavobacterium dankookense]